MPGPLRKDGKPDMRYKCNRESAIRHSNYNDWNPSGPLRKNGQPDMRYKCNRESAIRHSNYGDQKSAYATGSLYSSGNDRNAQNPPGPLRKNGQPDMRYKSNRESAITHVQKSRPTTTLRHPSLSSDSDMDDWNQPGPLKNDEQAGINYAVNEKYVAEYNPKLQHKIPVNITNVNDSTDFNSSDWDNIKFGLVNENSRKFPKIDKLKAKIEKSKLGIVAVTATWFRKLLYTTICCNYSNSMENINDC